MDSRSKIRWQEFLIEHAPKKDPDEALARLMHDIQAQSSGKRDAFLSELAEVAGQRRDGWNFALAALRECGGRAQRERLASAAESLPAVRGPHPLGDYREALLCVLASDPSGEFLRPVEAYGGESIGPGFTGVIWPLWPHHADLFARYHARYFVEQPQTSWAGTAVIQAFASRPDAVAAVRDVLCPAAPAVWASVRESILEASAAPWVDDRQAARIRRVCGAT